LRVLAEATSKHLGQQIIIDNTPGASGTLGGATMAATARPDGYTLAQLPITMFRLPYMQKTSFDPQKDFEPVGPVATAGYVLVANPAFPANNVSGLIAQAKQAVATSLAQRIAAHFAGHP
jgi:tripartite-type tricarboxylate transporter receptor subunit TctC